MRLLLAHNAYQQSGGEDQSFNAELAALRGAGHEVHEYRVHNDSIVGRSKLKVAMETVWSQPSFEAIGEIVREVRPDLVHFNNTFPLISPSAYYAVRDEGVPVIQSIRNYRLLCTNGLLSQAAACVFTVVVKNMVWLVGFTRLSTAALRWPSLAEDQDAVQESQGARATGAEV